ncbi:polysaccharide lyase [Streptomyces sp. OR43]|uniref:polysaccharide lyase n=1 Tax=Streptomyces sp. or43 TaxID=2478957 RepID=UPI0021CA4E2E|nr:polysaccharide lyase [Streptomyces sp. or43]
MPAFYLMAMRNKIAFRSPHLNQQAAVVPDLRPYVNQWMSFRVDARWTTDEAGCFKVSVRLPGESGYKPSASYENVRTYQPANPADHGYIKWGLYRPSESIGNGDVPTRGSSSTTTSAFSTCHDADSRTSGAGHRGRRRRRQSVALTRPRNPLLQAIVDL